MLWVYKVWHRYIYIIKRKHSPCNLHMLCWWERCVVHVYIIAVVLFMFVSEKLCCSCLYQRSCVLSICLRFLCNCCDWQVSVWRWRSRVHQHQILCVGPWMDSSVVTLTEEDVGPLRETRFANLVQTLFKEVGVLYILYVNIDFR